MVCTKIEGEIQEKYKNGIIQEKHVVNALSQCSVEIMEVKSDLWNSG